MYANMYHNIQKLADHDLHCFQAVYAMLQINFEIS